jgi:hypothetical protein
MSHDTCPRTCPHVHIFCGVMYHALVGHGYHIVARSWMLNVENHIMLAMLYCIYTVRGSAVGLAGWPRKLLHGERAHHLRPMCDALTRSVSTCKRVEGVTEES